MSKYEHCNGQTGFASKEKESDMMKEKLHRLMSGSRDKNWARGCLSRMKEGCQC